MTTKRDWSYFVALAGASLFSGLLAGLSWVAFVQHVRTASLAVALGLSLVSLFYLAGAVVVAIVPRFFR